MATQCPRCNKWFEKREDCPQCGFTIGSKRTRQKSNISGNPL